MACNRWTSASVLLVLVLVAAGAALWSGRVTADGVARITVRPSVPRELNPPFRAGPLPTGGAPNATPEQAAAFAWQEFIALNWPAGPQQGRSGQRDTPSTTCRFGDTSETCNLLVWETFRSKVEIFPGSGRPHGYGSSPNLQYWGYDATPVYTYAEPTPQIPACDATAAKTDNADPPWINLDETDQITLDSMYAGTVKASSSKSNSSPQLVRFLAKANRTQYDYVAKNKWWNALPTEIVQATQNYLMTKIKSPPPGSSNVVSLPDGTIEVKAAWRPLNASEVASGRFHTQTVRYYENFMQSDGTEAPCYHDAPRGDQSQPDGTTWGLIALHIIQKTPSAPYFIYATFEQADNILTRDGTSVEDADGQLKVLDPAAATSPQVCLQDPQPMSPSSGSGPSGNSMVILTTDPSTCTTPSNSSYCTTPQQQLYYQNSTADSAPANGQICVNKRDNLIPDYVIAANQQAHSAIAQYLSLNHAGSAPWSTYKLVNVQYYPYDKIPNGTPNGSLYNSNPPFTAKNPAPSSYYQANIVVETDRALQLFSGGLSPDSNVSTDWNADGTKHKNVVYGGAHFNMGGCMGCHGSQGQSLAGDFSVILARGAVAGPEAPAVPVAASNGTALTRVFRNRSIAR